MKCYKCGFEFLSGNACPKCGASAIMVNEDYLRRKKEYEESGKVTIKELEFKQSDDKNEKLVFDEDTFEPVDFIKNVYDKMKIKSSGSKNKTPSVKRKKKKADKKKEKIDFSKLKGLIPYVAALVFLICVIIIIAAMTRSKEYIYAISTNKESTYRGTKVLYYGDGLYISTNDKKQAITDKKVTKVNYNKTFTGIMYESEDGIYYHYGKKSTRIYDGKISDITSYFISNDGKHMSFVVLEDNVYVVYLVYGGKVEAISKGTDSKEVLVVLKDGTVLYKEIEYSSINGANYICLKSYNNGTRKTLVEDFIDGVYSEKNKALIAVDKAGNLIMYSGKDYSNAKVIEENVTSIYEEISPCVYTAYGEKYISSDSDKIIIKSDSLKVCNLKDMSVKKIADESYDVMLLCEDEFYGIKNNALYNKSGKKISSIGNVIPIYDIKKKGFLYYDDGKINMLSKGKTKMIVKNIGEVISLSLSDKYYAYTTSDNKLVIIKKNGKAVNTLKDTVL